MKNLGIIIFLIGVFISGAPLLAYATVVINELYYDHSGGDSNHEFLELYNNAGSSVDILGWQIQWGGADFTYGNYTIPSTTIIYGFDYFLIGGTETFSDFGVTPDLIRNFNFQNGPDTDGVRIWDGATYYDTILYGSLSPHLSAEEGGWDDGEYAPDVSHGHSLIRKTTGVDTNYASDWEDCSSPNPNPSVIPEPSTLILLGSGLIGLVGILYRRKQQRGID